MLLHSVSQLYYQSLRSTCSLETEYPISIPVMTASTAGEDFDDEVCLHSCHQMTTLIKTSQDFIVDIDGIQAHGVSDP